MFSLDKFKYRTGEQLVINYVLKPLSEAYSKMNKADKCAVDYDENTITKKIVWYLKHETKISGLYQKKLIAIEMRPMEQETATECYEPDIKVFVWKRLWIEIEAKRLYCGNSWTTSEYMGDEGINRFLSNRYSTCEKFGGMVGYVQNGDVTKIIQKIKKELLSKDCKNWNDIAEVDNCFLSFHYRKGNADIGLFHIFFHFSQYA